MAIGPGEQPTNPVNIIRFLAGRPGSIQVIAHKLWKRFMLGRGAYSDAENCHWLDRHTVDARAFAARRESELWQEASCFGETLRSRAKDILASVPFNMGGGGDYEFLYWLTRYLRPEYVVETGVSAGWSTEAFLTAMSVNGCGTLYSSDFPYFRVANPEKYIGILVSPHLKGRWHLSIEGDEKALPQIFNEIRRVDLMHYDSDKSYSGRMFAVDLAKKKLAADGVMLIDDIRDNSWFREYVEDEEVPFAVFSRCGLIDASRRLLQSD